MSEIVFILGAGASQGAGAPVMNKFLDKSRELVRLGDLDKYSEDFDRVFDARSKLQIVHSKSDFDLNNLESVFAAFEMGRLIKSLPRIDAEDISQLLVSMRKLIQVTLERTIKYPIVKQAVSPPLDYLRFAQMIKDFLDHGHSCSIITFNYDYALDYALNEVGIPANYCLPDQESGENRVTPLLKLHGSLNWVKCPSCGTIIPVSIGKLKSHFHTDMVAAKQTAPIQLSFSTRLEELKIRHCENLVDVDPVIVPPSWNKTEYQGSLSAVWSKAAQELSEAESVFVSGYALNESDLFFRYLFALGTVGDKLIQRFCVINVDPEEGLVDKRFQQMLGNAIRSRYHYYQANFSEIVDIVQRKK